MGQECYNPLMNSIKILLIDDDERLGDALKSYLEKYKHKVEYANHPDLGIKMLKDLPLDLIILDIMMPDKDGFEVCREIRSFSDIPIIFLSARGDITDRIVGLELGADDFLPKPFEPRELLARIESVQRRVQKNSIQSGGLELDNQAMEAHLNGKLLDLTSMEFEALYFLHKNRHQIVSRDDLLNDLQGMEVEVYGRAIDILISRIRQKLGEDSKNPQFIKTVRGQGYRFIGGGK